MNKLLSIEYDDGSGLMHFHREHNSKAYYVTVASWIRLFVIVGKHKIDGKMRFSDKWRWIWSIRENTCPSCYGAGVLHADGYSSIGCPKCWGTGEIE